MAKSKAEIQQEYNEALKVSQSLTGALNKMIDNTEKSQKKVSDAQKKFNDELKSINSGATDYESTQDSILALEKQKAGLAKRYFGANAKILPQKQKEVQANIDILKNEGERIKLVNSLDNAAQDLAGSINGSLDGLLDGLDGIPVIGKGLSKLASGPVNHLKGAFSDSAKIFTTKFSTALASGKSGMQSFGIAASASMKVVAKAIFSPLGVIALFTAALYAGAIAFHKMEQGAKSFRDETGLLNSQTKEMEGNIAAVFTSTVGLGASMEDVAKAAAEFTNEFGGIEQPSRQVMESMMVLNKNFGIATGDLAKINKAFTNLGGLSQDVAQSNIESLTALSQQAGVAPSKVMADIAEAAEDSNGFFRGNVQALGASAINAAKMGSSLKEAVRVSKGLLDYQSSVSSEMEASAILQTNLNFSQSRYLAAAGKPAEAQAAMVKQLRETVNLSQLNTYEQEALEKATGMSLLQMTNMARVQELGLSLDKDRAKLLGEATQAGLDIANMSADDIRNKLQALKVQKEQQGAIENMQNEFSALGQKALMAFLPIGKVLVKGLSKAIPIIEGIGDGITFMSSGISKFGNAVMKALTPVKTILGSFITLFTEGPQAFLDKLKEMGPVLSAITGVVGTLASIWVVSILPSVVATVTSLAVGMLGALATAIPAIITFAVSMASAAIAAISTASAMTLGIGALAIAGGIAAAAVAMDSSIDSTKGKIESVDDGVISPDGNIISTHPEDFLIATKSPETLTNTISDSGMVSMDGVIKELRELKAAFISNKDVYIDNEKITSRITRTQEKSNINQFGLLGA
jgi:hypothetical protein